MPVKARRNDQKFRLERGNTRQDRRIERFLYFGCARSGHHTDIEDIIGTSAFAFGPGAGIKRPLVGRAIKQVRIIIKQVLRAVAVMDIEIHHRHPLDAEFVARMVGGNGGIVKQAKPHRPVIFGVMPRRPGGDKGILFMPLHHRIDRNTGPAD